MSITRRKYRAMTLPMYRNGNLVATNRYMGDQLCGRMPVSTHMMNRILCMAR